MLNNNQFAIFLIIISIIFGTLMGTFIKLAQEELNVFTTGFLRFFFGVGGGALIIADSFNIVDDGFRIVANFPAVYKL